MVAEIGSVAVQGQRKSKPKAKPAPAKAKPEPAATPEPAKEPAAPTAQMSETQRLANMIKRFAPTTVTADTPVKLLGLTEWVFRGLVQEHPSIAVKTLQAMAARLRSATKAATA